MALAAADLAAGPSGAFVVNGSPTQTEIVEGAGSQSQIAQMSTAVVVGFVLLFATKPLQYLPRCVLSALVLYVALKLIELRGLRAIRRESAGEYFLAVTAAVVVVAGVVEQGILVAMVISLLRIVKHSYHPHRGVMILDANGTWRVVPVRDGLTTQPGLVIYYFGAALFYANARRFSDEVLCTVGKTPSEIKWVIVDAEAITNVDYSASRVVLELQRHLAEAGVRLAFARLAVSCKDDFDRHHLTEAIGAPLLFDRIDGALSAFLDAQRGRIEVVC